MDSEAVLERTTEYCSGLYNYQLHPDTFILKDVRIPGEKEESLPVIKEEVEQAILSLKPGKSPGVDNVSAELV